jgi:hypothetical protein
MLDGRIHLFSDLSRQEIFEVDNVSLLEFGIDAISS